MAGKPKPPKLDLQAVQALKDAFDAPSILFNRLSELEERNKAGTVNTAFIALEAIAIFLELYDQGIDQEDIKRSWLDEWGTGSIEVPTAVLAALAYPWMEYKVGPSGKTLGEHFGLEGGGSGKRPLKNLSKKADENVKLSNEVVIEYLAASQSGPISIEAAQARIAERFDVSLDTVGNAYKANKKRLESRLKEVGIILG